MCVRKTDDTNSVVNVILPEILICCCYHEFYNNERNNISGIGDLVTTDSHGNNVTGVIRVIRAV